MPRSSVIFAMTLCLAGALALPARADALKNAFLELPAAERVAVQAELARADLYLARTDGRWSSTTERALQRGADRLAQVSRNRVHPVLHRSEGARSYLDALKTGAYAALLVADEATEGWGFLSGN